VLLLGDSAREAAVALGETRQIHTVRRTIHQFRRQRRRVVQQDDPLAGRVQARDRGAEFGFELASQVAARIRGIGAWGVRRR